jgi:hypothetical protein
VSYTPALRLRRERQPLVGDILALAIFGIVGLAVLAWGVMPGPSDTPQAPGVAVVKTVRTCAPDSVLPTDPYC